MVIDRGGREILLFEGTLPREHVALEYRRNVVMAILLPEEGGEAVEVQGDLRGHGRGADADHSEGEIARHPCRERIGYGVGKGIRKARHLS